MDEQELIARWIERNPNKPSPDEVVIRDFYVPVWALIGDGAANDDYLEQVAAGYELPLEAVEAAVAYYRRNKPFIDVRLAQNAAFFED